MIAGIMKKAGIRSYWPALLVTLTSFGLLSLAVISSIQYVVNTYRSTDHWVVYYSVEPTSDVFDLGTQPQFKSVAQWNTETDAQFGDRMWCRADSGVLGGGMVIRINSPSTGRHEARYPRTVGFTDDQGKTLEGGFAGYWEWDGKVPRVESQCWLQPLLKIYPSPLVVRDVPMPDSRPFRFVKAD